MPFLSDNAIDLGLEDYTDEFFNAMKTWNLPRILKPTGVEWYKEIGYSNPEKEWERCEQRRLEKMKKFEKAERIIKNKLRALERVTALVLDPGWDDSFFITLHLKVGPIGMPQVNLDIDTLKFTEYEENLENNEQAGTVLSWKFYILEGTIPLRETEGRPLKFKEWSKELSSKKFW